MAKAKNFKGFTLIEILVVVALIAILTAITFIAINPAKNFADTSNAQRSSDVGQILNAMTQYTSDSGRTTAALETEFAVAIPSCDAVAPSPTAIQIGSGVGLLNLGDATKALVDEYIVGIPFDPSTGTAAATNYWVCQTTGGRLQVSAPGVENGKPVIVVKR